MVKAHNLEPPPASLGAYVAQLHFLCTQRILPIAHLLALGAIIFVGGYVR